MEYDAGLSHVGADSTFIVTHSLTVMTEDSVGHVPSVVPANQLEKVQGWLNEIPQGERVGLSAKSTKVVGPSILISVISYDIEKHQVFEDPHDTIDNAVLQEGNDLISAVVAAATLVLPFLLVGIFAPTPLHRASFRELVGLVVAHVNTMFGLFAIYQAWYGDMLFNAKMLTNSSSSPQIDELTIYSSFFTNLWHNFGIVLTKIT